MLKKSIKNLSIALSFVFIFGLSPVSAKAATSYNQNNNAITEDYYNNGKDLQSSFIKNNSKIIDSINFTNEDIDEVRNLPATNVGVIDFFHYDDYIIKDGYCKQFFGLNIPTDIKYNQGTQNSQLVYAINPNINLYVHNISDDSVSAMTDSYINAINTLVKDYNVKILNISNFLSHYISEDKVYYAYNNASEEDFKEANTKIEAALNELLDSGYDFLIIRDTVDLEALDTNKRDYFHMDKSSDLFTGIKDKNISSRIITVNNVSDNGVLKVLNSFSSKADVITPKNNFKLFSLDKTSLESTDNNNAALSTGLVTGLASAIQAKDPTLSCTDIKTLITDNTNDGLNPLKDSFHKMIDVHKTLNACENTNIQDTNQDTNNEEIDTNNFQLNNNIILKPSNNGQFFIGQQGIDISNDKFYEFNNTTTWMKGQTINYKINDSTHKIIIEDMHGYFNLILDNNIVIQNSASIRAISHIDLDPDDDSEELFIYYYGINEGWPFTLILSFNNKDNNYSIVTRTNDYIGINDNNQLIGLQRAGEIIDTDCSVYPVGKYSQYGFSELYLNKYTYEDNNLNKTDSKFIGYIY